MMDSFLYYLASPYTHEDKTVKKARAEAVTKAAVDLLHQGIFVFAPIAYNAPWEKYQLPGNWKFWEKYDKTYVDRCDALLVLQLEGWDTSVGVSAEIEYAKQEGKPIFYITEEQIASGETDFLVKSAGKVVVKDGKSVWEEDY